MKRAFVLTAYDRPEYLEPVVSSLMDVRGWENWHVVFSIEPSAVTREVKRIIAPFLAQVRTKTSFEVKVNPHRLGVLEHPWHCFETLFQKQEFDFVVRAEDDVLVSSDILEYFDWASETYLNDPSVAVACSFSYSTDGNPAEVVRRNGFNPLVWGTWKDRWAGALGPTWDHDYSTNNGLPGVESGWDWNLNTRILPQNGWDGVFPSVTRAKHIGVVGTHGTAENFVPMAGFTQGQGQHIFFEGR